MRKLSESFPIILVVAIFALTFLGNIVFDNLVYAWLMRTLQSRLGVEEAEVISGFSSIAGPLLAAVLVVYGLYWFLRRELEQQSPPEKEQLNRPHLEVGRVDPENQRLAGLVSAMAERAGSYSFRFPLPDGDPFLSQHEELKNSQHPIWTDDIINQCKREFINRCHRLGAKETVPMSANEFNKNVSELQSFGRHIIANLLGENSNPVTLSLKDAARIAYEQTRGGQFSKSAEGFDGSDNGIIQYYASHIITTATLFGKRPPSTRIERINARTPQVFLRFNDEHLEGYRNHDTDHFCDLEILRSDLDEAIERIKEIGGKIPVNETGRS